MGAALKTTRRGLFGHAAGVYLAAGALTTGIGAVSLASLWERRAMLLAEEARLDAEYRAAEARYEACKPPLPPEAIVPAQLAKGQGWMTTTDKDGNRILIGYEQQWRRWSHLLIGGYWPDECARRADVMLEYERSTDALRKQIVAEHSQAANRNSGELWELEEHMLAVPAAGVRDLAMKAAIVRRHDGFTLSDTGATCASTLALLADIERLALSA